MASTLARFADTFGFAASSYGNFVTHPIKPRIQEAQVGTCAFWKSIIWSKAAVSSEERMYLKTDTAESICNRPDPEIYPGI